MGQFADNKKIAGATLASVNKVAFQLTTADAQELATEFALPPPVEYRRQQELVISQSPFFDLLHGHANPAVRDFVNTYLRHMQDELDNIQAEKEKGHLNRLAAIDELGLSRINERFAGLGRGAISEFLQKSAINQSAGTINDIQQHTFYLLFLHSEQEKRRINIREINRFFTALMEKRVQEGDKDFIRFLINRVYQFNPLQHAFLEVLATYLSLIYSAPGATHNIPFDIAHTCSDPLIQQLARCLKEFSDKKRRDVGENIVALAYEERRKNQSYLPPKYAADYAAYHAVVVIPALRYRDEVIETGTVKKRVKD